MDINFDYTSFGITTSGNSISQKLVNKHDWGTSIGSRLFLLNEDLQYEMFYLNGNEFSFDIDISQIPCGLAATLFSVEMAHNGSGVGAIYGAGYCDAQFVGGLGCAEFDFWEANNHSNLVTSHACDTTGQFKSGNSKCDSNGCGYNPYWDDKKFYGAGASNAIDTSKKFTVITQFVTEGSSLSEVRRKYVQNGKTFDSPGGLDARRCNNTNYPLSQMGKSFDKGHAIVWALWDSSSGMAWLDSDNAGVCGGTNESSSYVETHYPDATVTFSNIRFGPIGSTAAAMAETER